MEPEIDWEKEIYGRGYARIDRERFRLKKGDFWSGLNGIGPDGTLMIEWERTFGSALNLVKPFLKLSGRAEEYVACPGSSSCGCMHYVSETHRGELVATCQCSGEDEWDCETYQLDPEDVLVHGLDWHLFAEEIRKALGFARPNGAAYVSRDFREIGTYAAVAAPVYLCLAGGQALLRELARMQGLRDGPFLVLTATGSTWREEVEAMARPHGGGHISLSSVLAPDGQRFRVVGALQPMLDDFAKRLAKGKGLATMVQRIESNLQAIAEGASELRRENDGLKEMQGEGLFKFALRVEVEDFQAFAAVMALGNRKAAAEFLDVPLRTFYDRVDSWKSRGRDHQRMFRLVEWRKATGRKIQVRLEDSLLSGDGSRAENPETLGDVLAKMKEAGPDNRGYPEILRQVWQALREQNAGNWSGVREELVEFLGEEVGG